MEAKAHDPVSNLRSGASNLKEAKKEILLTGGILLPEAKVNMLRKKLSMKNLPAGPNPYLGTGAFGYSTCSNTGSFIPKRCDRGGCGRKANSRISDFAELGSGVSSYFKVQKTLAILFTLLAIVYIPNVLINVGGGNDAGTSLSPLAQTVSDRNAPCDIFSSATDLTPPPPPTTTTSADPGQYCGSELHEPRSLPFRQHALCQCNFSCVLVRRL